MRDEYVVWAVIIVVVILALVYSWGNGGREHLDSQNYWGPETPMSAATGYPRDDGKQEFQSYMKYIRDTLQTQGKCPKPDNSMNCVNIGGPDGLRSLDMAKSYCSTVNCTGIISSTSPGGKMFIPLTSGLVQTVPKGPDGKPISFDKLPKIILRKPMTQENVAPQTSTPATAAISAPTDPGDSYILKSSLVPCTCTTHTMGCEKHAGGTAYSVAPGDHDSTAPTAQGNSDQGTAQRQSGLMRPFSSAFSNQGEPTGFLNSFSAFG